ncbi:superoxide dismutase [Brevibacillus fulvus]|uniref:superoxide dismutase n=1 Tax=Brevibacillus fulvus TaxID=1125967 RepID=A0A938XYP2_9BACL|nr:superoxide dismutase [Brevibacillus fulvus]MBM7590068.1 Fe-Mn family superoxide dismutase [Brevibacillus fulvus]
MKQDLESLRQWCDWGQQWISYLRQKPQLLTAELGKQLGSFSDAFSQLQRKAADIRKKPQANLELYRLTAKAEEVERHFEQFLRLVQDNASDPNRWWSGQEGNADQRSETPVFQPVPIGKHTLPPLPYAYDALEPYIDAETMRLHHDKHHQSYVDGLNKAETMMAQARATNQFDLIKHWEREAAFHGAGHYLHTIFWTIMSPQGGGMPQGELLQQINRDFGSFDAFKRHFSQAAEKVEGGGWAILVWSPRAQHLEILTAEKHQNLSQWDVIPLLVLDVWEHAYYLSYRNDRAKYIQAWWEVVNWPEVQNRFVSARQLIWQPY